MRIVQVVHSFYPSVGGIENHTFELARQLSKDNDIVVYTTGKERKDEKLDDFTVRRFTTFRFPFFSSVNFSPGLLIALIRDNGEIFHSHGFGSLMPYFTSIIAAIKRTPFVFTLHGYPRQRGALAIFQKIYEIFFGPIFLWKASRVISVSTIIPPELKRYGKKIVYIPNGVPGKFACDSGTSDKKAITYIGRLDKDKNIPLLIRGFARLSNDELQLRICGKDEGAKPELEKLANDLNVEVEFTETPYERIGEIYCDSKAIVLPSRYEGFPLIWLESIACSRPIFSTRVGDYRHFFFSVFGNDAERFLFDDERELEEKLSEFLDNEKEYGAIIRNAREKLMAEYDWMNVAKKIVELYKTVLEKR